MSGVDEDGEILRLALGVVYQFIQEGIGLVFKFSISAVMVLCSMFAVLYFDIGCLASVVLGALSFWRRHVCRAV